VDALPLSLFLDGCFVVVYSGRCFAANIVLTSPFDRCFAAKGMMVRLQFVDGCFAAMVLWADALLLLTVDNVNFY
jgi:hypothetical protein